MLVKAPGQHIVQAGSAGQWCEVGQSWPPVLLGTVQWWPRTASHHTERGIQPELHWRTDGSCHVTTPIHNTTPIHVTTPIHNTTPLHPKFQPY